MRKIRNVLLLCLVAIVMTGCVKYNATMTIKDDKSMDFTIVYAFDKSMMGNSGSLKEEDFEELKKTGYTVEKYSEGNYEGFTMSKKISNIDEVSTDKDVVFNLSGMMKNNEDNKYMFKVVKDGNKSTYYATFKFDSNDSGLNDDDDEEFPDEENIVTAGKDEDLLTTTSEDDVITTTGEDDDFFTTSEDETSSNLDLSGLMGSMDLSFKVNLPNGAISSNATTKENDNKNLTWKLGYTGSQNIEFAFEIDANAKSNNMLLYIGIGAGVLLIAVVAIVLMLKKKKPTETPVVSNPAPTVEEPKTEEPKE